MRVPCRQATTKIPSVAFLRPYKEVLEETPNQFLAAGSELAPRASKSKSMNMEGELVTRSKHVTMLPRAIPTGAATINV